MTNLLVLATEGAEGVDPGHVAANISIPLAIVIFVGAIYALVWSNYGAKKGALIYSVAFFGFTFMLGVFWWFGAPGTPVATGLQNFPGQAPDAYIGQWYAFEPGSPRAQFFDATNDLSQFQTVEEFVGTDDPADPELSFVKGELEQGSQRMLAQYFPTDESGGLRVGATRRTAWAENSPAPEDGEQRADPFYTAVPVENLLTKNAGVTLASSRYEIRANYVDADGKLTREVVVEEGHWFAFKDPGRLWFPSAVWTFVSLLLFIVSLFALDRMEQREKREVHEVEEAEDLAVPIAQ